MTRRKGDRVRIVDASTGEDCGLGTIVGAEYRMSGPFTGDPTGDSWVVQMDDGREMWAGNIHIQEVGVS